ncbi:MULTISPECIES: phage tail protein [unclassified Tatumella]|uniref:phage tail protein n=1 Tax=unclassified Tatumella TaxID=2649542 RepID=UPI001BB09B7B|nr:MULTISPECIES: phage tail protein [unclassified Tatumella]MBS0878393.1 phage tail protein [Tatumella sp. JGM82]MBS0891189.1 phage tail protein [Tatumella sp. JGM94]MBS0902746.1 phage tail protein [Tatumella sp. JGM100]
MADTSLQTPVNVQASRIDATLLPQGFSQPYSLYVIQQGSDLGNVAGKANEAGNGAYDAQVKNDEQDIELADHEKRLTAAETELADHEKRLQAAEAELADHEKRIAAAETELTDHEKRISDNETELQDHESRITKNTDDISSLGTAQQADREDIDKISGDYLSKSATSSQSLAGPLNVASSYSVNGTKVIGPRQTGWSLSTGTANKSAFNADQSYTVGAVYSQAEVQAIVQALIETRQRVKALEDMAATHGLISDATD